MECLARIAGMPAFPNIVEVNVRSAPTTADSNNIIFKAPVGMDGLRVLQRADDAAGNNKDGKVYKWLLLSFPGGATGWARDDLIEIQGDCGAFGYGIVPERKFAFDLPMPTTATILPPPNVGSAVSSASSAVSNVTAPTQPTTPTAPSTGFPAIPPPVTTAATTSTTTTPPPPPAGVPTITTSPAPVSITTPPAVSSTGAIASSGARVENVDRVKKASFHLTMAFEGTYASLNTYDAGIVSYGAFQFTLAAGSLYTVLEKYLATSNSAVAGQLRGYAPRVQNRDAGLKGDQNFLNLLRQAANEPEMQAAQDDIATVKYWDAVYKGYIEPRALQTPLGWALLFDMGINFGTGHGFVRMAEEQLGVPSRSRPGENGITEETLIAKVAQLRKESHDKQAARDNLPGLAVRGNFWMDLVKKGDWSLQGDVSGTVNINGKIVQVRNP